VLTAFPEAAKEKMFSYFGPQCVDPAARFVDETCIEAHGEKGQKTHQGVASKNLAPYQGITWSKSTTALGLPGVWLENGSGSRCTGKERDSEAGLDYFGARYYENGLGRFMSADWAAKPEAIPYAQLGDPQSLNLYTYVRNIPTSAVDSDGHQAEVIGGTIGTFVEPGLGTAIGIGIGMAIDTGLGVYLIHKTTHYGTGKYHETKHHLGSSHHASRVQPGKGSPSPGTQTGTQAGTQPKDVYIDPTKYPGSAGHAQDAINAGKPDVLTVDRSGAADRRADALKGTSTKPGTDRDEYPPAVTKEGGAGADVTHIDSGTIGVLGPAWGSK
jgi:RHS repeat-associated protein